MYSMMVEKRDCSLECTQKEAYVASKANLIIDNLL